MLCVSLCFLRFSGRDGENPKALGKEKLVREGLLKDQEPWRRCSQRIFNMHNVSHRLNFALEHHGVPWVALSVLFIGAPGRDDQEPA